ncbi:arginine biosynthesis bifunctional protein ArgJ [Chloroherpeton thalassium ATCC 35110]|uniref:Arginine biosynthesis bifunctional protein ArgJ n=2 Tax=Chloroherpeton thalassium TaxID=100716 RepID=B3QWG9_CHLT3|nr:arginine biosynthesis bifunctional protein ArgJ [Chloroherpeton thalassium ATCC 35110]
MQTPKPEHVSILAALDQETAEATPKGFSFAGLHSGVKNRNKDLMLSYSEHPAIAAGVFTTNVVKAPPVVLSQEFVAKSNAIRAIVCNSGNANACTGEPGMKDAKAMAEITAKALKILPEEVVVSSTGVIGRLLPMEPIKNGILQASQELSPIGFQNAAAAIMTTDTFTKTLFIEIELVSGKKVKLCGMAKGSGMIHPNMATMLAFLSTDATFEKSVLQQALSESNQCSFNCISVDGDTSTNDMVVVLANGAAQAELIEPGSENYDRFQVALQYLMTVLGKLIVLDGEGATKFIELNIEGAETDEDARLAGKTVATSSLFKTALFGEDANWGRIIAALGRSGAVFNPADVEVSFNGLPILQKNYDIVIKEEEAKRVLKERLVEVHIKLGEGSGSAKVWTCDLTDGYIHINADYRT